mgnify:CR=1 FL=1
MVTDVLKFTDCVARGKARAGNRQIAVASFLATWFSGSRGSWNPSETSNRGFGRSVASAPGPGWGQACSMTSAVVLAEATKTDVDSAPVSEVRRDPRNGADPGSPRRRRREHSRPPPHLPPRRPSRRARASTSEKANAPRDAGTFSGRRSRARIVSCFCCRFMGFIILQYEYSRSRYFAIFSRIGIGLKRMSIGWMDDMIISSDTRVSRASES